MIKETLHDSQGLRIVRNEHNQFIIATVHHTADPAKRGDIWRRVAGAGMSPEKFAREYDIDYTAVQGSKVFPEITLRKDKIIVPPMVDLPSGVRCWGGFDFGWRNPASFHVYTILDGITYSIWELYKPCQNIGEFAAEMRACPYWNQIRYVAADPSIFNPSQHQTLGTPIAVAELFRQAGIRNLIKGRNDMQAEDAWVAMMRKHWGDPDEVTFRIAENCPNQIHEFETIIYTPQTERQLMNSTFKESLNDRDNHSLDDCKYFMLSQPVGGGLAPSGWQDPQMATRWTAAKPATTHRKPVGPWR